LVAIVLIGDDASRRYVYELTGVQAGADLDPEPPLIIGKLELLLIAGNALVETSRAWGQRVLR
jgi:hypothetical protein